MTIAIRADHVSKAFEARSVIADLSLRIDSGRAFGLLGPNGAGKTTTVRLLTGLLSPTAGTIELFGEPLTAGNAARLRERIGVQTDTNLYETLTVRDNLRTWGELYGVDRARIPARIDELLSLLGLEGRADSLAGELSKGMRQKVAVARAVLHEPSLLFLDEPTAGLDPEAAADVVDYLRRLIHAGGTTLVLCTHQLFGLESLCTDVGILVGGRLALSGPVADVLHERWPRTRVRLRAGTAASARRVLDAAGIAGLTVSRAEHPDLMIEADAEDAVPAAVAALVAAGLPVYAVEPIRPTLEELYFSTVSAVTGDATSERSAA